MITLFGGRAVLQRIYFPQKILPGLFPGNIVLPRRIIETKVLLVACATVENDTTDCDPFCFFEIKKSKTVILFIFGSIAVSVALRIFGPRDKNPSDQNIYNRILFRNNHRSGGRLHCDRSGRVESGFAEKTNKLDENYLSPAIPATVGNRVFKISGSLFCNFD